MVMGSEVNGNLMHLSSQLSDAQKLGLDRQGLNKQALSFETSSFDSSSVDNK
jgi:hypothetical protein